MAIRATRILALFITITMLLAPSAAFPCGPVFPTAVFSLTGGPDAPRQNFLRGDLGVLQPGFRSYDLVPAYRYLVGTGLSAEEQQELLGEAGQDANTHAPARAGEPEDWVRNWLDARGSIKDAGAAPAIGWHSPGSSSIYRTEQKEGNYANYLNCGEDAFRTAIATLGERIRMFGTQSLEILSWVKAQDAVFSNCSRGRTLPDPEVPGNTPVLKADRAYQIAAANFYSGDFDQAEKLFIQISQDKTSPWRTIAPYLAARSQVRSATLRGGFQNVETASMSRAEASLRSILQNSGLSPYHKAAEDLLGYVETRLHPAEQLYQVALALSKKDAGREIGQSLKDFRYLLMNTDRQAQKEAGSLDDLADWVITFQDQTPDALEHSIERWEKTGSQAWLIAAISKMPAGHPRQQTVQAEADKLPPTAAGYQTAVYHSIRLLVDSGRQEAAKKRLDNLLGDAKLRLSVSARNLLLGLRMRLSAGLDEFLQYAQRTPAAVGYGYDEDDLYMDQKVKEEYAGQKMLDDDSVRIMNGYLPQSMLVEIASKSIQPQKIRKEIALAAWVRAVLLQDEEAIKNNSALLSSVAPDMQEQLKALAAAGSPQERAFAASFVILKNPGMKPFIVAGIGRTTPLDKIDSYRDNWWCMLGSKSGPLRRKDRSEAKPGKKTDYPAFMTRDQAQRAEQEIQALEKTGIAPDYLAAIVLSWAEAHRDDPRVPEALHLVVKATRYGCEGDETHRYSKAAFKLLHKHYPKSTWTKETPFYF